MSTLDNKAREVNGSGMVDSSHSSRAEGSGFIFLMFIFGLMFSMIIGWIVFPNFLYSKKQQPFNFNHALHIDEVSEGCESCHFFYDDGRFSGIPKIEQCLDCHSEVMGESEDELIFVENYVNEGKEVPWFVYSKQPNCVFFSHAAHIKGSDKLDCIVCHGYIEKLEKTRPYEYNKLTGYSRDIWGRNIAGIKKNSWDRMKMDDCAKCHEEAGEIHVSSAQTGRDACFVCHK